MDSGLNGHAISPFGSEHAMFVQRSYPILANCTDWSACRYDPETTVEAAMADFWLLRRQTCWTSGYESVDERICQVNLLGHLKRSPARTAVCGKLCHREGIKRWHRGSLAGFSRPKRQEPSKRRPEFPLINREFHSGIDDAV